MRAAASSRRLEEESGGRQGPCPPPGEVVDEVEGPDLISLLPDDLLGEIITRLPTKAGARTQVLSRRWRPLWRAAPLNLEAAVEHRSEVNHAAAIAGTLRAHGGPVRRLSVAWRGQCHRFPELDSVLRSPMLGNLQEFDLLYSPLFEYHSPRPRPVTHSVASVLGLSSTTLRVLSISSSTSILKKLKFPKESVCTLSFPRLEELTLSGLRLSESTLHGLLSGSPVLVSLVLVRNTGLGRRLRISSPTLRSLGVSASWERKHIALPEIIVADVPQLERLFPLSTLYHEPLRVIHAPKLKALGYLSCQTPMFELGNMVFKKLVPVSLPAVTSTVKILALATDPNLDLVIGFLECFPSVEKLYIEFYEGYTNNVHRYASLKCLDLHLKMVQFASYQSKVSYVNFAKFFVLNARVLEYMKFAVYRDECDAKWISCQHNELQLNDRASQYARFEFEADYRELRGSAHIEDIHDLATDDPFGR